MSVDGQNVRQKLCEVSRELSMKMTQGIVGPIINFQAEANLKSDDVENLEACFINPQNQLGR